MRERCGQERVDVLREGEAQNETDDEGDDRDDEPLAQLDQMIE
jgi:hypothetical protein